MKPTPARERPTDRPDILDPDRTELLRALDAGFTGWARAEGAREIVVPPLYGVADLEKFDVYQNFPQLAFLAAPLSVTEGEPPPATTDLGTARFGLPHSACLGAYLFHEDSELAGDTVLTMVQWCFRNEDHYVPLRRQAAFQMRETVALGSYEHTQRLLDRAGERITAFGAALGLGLAREAASDPFFARDGARALMSRLSPVKHEFRFGDLALASVNTHRNFFGERCRIRLAGTSEYAYTSCVAFGLERWVAVLLDAHGTAARATEAVRAAAGALR
ncbi:hypothetical protein KUM39_15330 [Streptomyces sp. J2-1]|uniref:hypothetical protein n=1 Tax=Streptomyces corallincola TaxID=2851888 RepID=UPI001C38A488|nr:hypothetical protein [Streptomyces corallincola]MBV2355730.1 hypothetical protein [Streptomyces corallincola]